jgi:hypothetical protein
MRWRWDTRDLPTLASKGRDAEKPSSNIPRALEHVFWYRGSEITYHRLMKGKILIQYKQNLVSFEDVDIYGVQVLSFLKNHWMSRTEPTGLTVQLRLLLAHIDGLSMASSNGERAWEWISSCFGSYSSSSDYCGSTPGTMGPVMDYRYLNFLARSTKIRMQHNLTEFRRILVALFQYWPDLYDHFPCSQSW